MVMEILLALFAAAGVAACLRLLAGRLVYPLRGAVILLPARGDGRELEHQLKGVYALSAGGRLEQETICIADAGLNDEGRAAALRLCRRYPALRLCRLEQEEHTL